MATGTKDSVTHVPAGKDLPAYVLRTSNRAKHVRLRVSAHEGLVVVVPSSLAGFDPSQTLRDRREWIEAATAEFAERRALLSAPPDSLLPREIEFPATGELWQVVYQPGSATRATAAGTSDRLVVRGPASDAPAALRALRRWLHRAAAARLLPMLASESARTGLAPSRSQIRAQRARWGGCSPSGTISLNRCLLFLAPTLVRSVIVHELAHLAQPNHSAAFWRELERFDPDARAHHEAIRLARDSIPPWAEPQ